MLIFCNRNVYMDVEMPFSALNKLQFTENLYYKDNLPIQQSTNTRVINMHPMIITMSVKQLRGFIKEWYNNSKFNKLFDWNIDEWIEEYITSIVELSNIMGDTLDYLPFNNIFRERQHWLLNHLDNGEEQSPIIFNSECLPEYSWMVEDFLSCNLQNKTSIYEQYIKNMVNINKEKVNEYTNSINLIGDNVINIKEFQEFKSITDFNYLYFPLAGEKIRSNYKHIKKCLSYYLERQC